MATLSAAYLEYLSNLGDVDEGVGDRRARMERAKRRPQQQRTRATLGAARTTLGRQGRPQTAAERARDRAEQVRARQASWDDPSYYDAARVHRAQAERERRAELGQRQTDPNGARNTGVPEAPPEYDMGTGGSPTYDYSDTTALRGGKAFAGAAIGAADTAARATGGYIARGVTGDDSTLGQYRATSKVRRMGQALAPRNWLGLKKKMSRGHAKEIDKLLKEVQSDRDLSPEDKASLEAKIKKMVREEEEDLHQWRADQERDIRSHGQAVKRGVKIGKKRARKMGRGVAYREIASAIPRAYVRYRTERDREKAAVIGLGDLERKQMDQRTRALDRKVDQSRSKYLSDIRDEYRGKKNYYRESLDVTDMTPRELIEDVKERRENRKKVNRREMRRYGSRRGSQHRPQRRVHQDDDYEGIGHLKGSDDDVKARGGQRTKKAKTKRGKASPYHTDIGDAGGSKHDNLDHELGDTKVKPVRKRKKRYKPSDVTRTRGRKQRKARDYPGEETDRYAPYDAYGGTQEPPVRRKRKKKKKRTSRAYEHFTQKLEVYGGSSLLNKTMVQKNASMSSSPKAKPMAPKPMASKPMVSKPVEMGKKMGEEEEPKRAKRASDMGPSHRERVEKAKHSAEMSKEKSSLGDKAKSAAGTVARATGADELAKAPANLHQNIKHHFVHKFLLR